METLRQKIPPDTMVDEPREPPTPQSVEPADWRFYLSPEAAWDAMYRDCEAATESIEFEQYILNNDAVGQKFMRLFIDKAKAGLRVFIICDKFGSASLFGSSLVRQLRRHGGRFHFYHPITYWTLLAPWKWFPRTHVKTMLIDSRIVYVGGVCLAQRMKVWRDTQLRVTGPAALQVKAAFHNLELAIQRARPAETVPHPPEDEFVYLQNQPQKHRSLVYDEIIQNIAGAEKYLYISTAFFAPNRAFLALLEDLGRRGVAVILLVPRLSDVPMADFICLSYARQLLEAGVRLFHYQPTVLHNKIVMMDDRWATVGSTNIDVISFFHNRESNLVISNRDAVLELKREFLRDLDRSHEFTRDSLGEIPLWKKAAGFAGRMIKVFY